MVTPFGPSTQWVREYVRGSISGKPDENSRREAGLLTGLKGKDYAHCLLWDRRLTIPVEGGGKVLKNKDANPLLSEHGKWRREHKGAWLAAYGRTPFYHHLIADIEEVYDSSDGLSLETFNRRLLGVALQWIDPSVVFADDDTTTAIRTELEERIDISLSIFDAIFRLGKEVSYLI